MSIQRIVTSPADLTASGFVFDKADESRYDKTRVAGAFRIGGGTFFDLANEPPAGDVMWYHFRMSRNSDYFAPDDPFRVYDSNSNAIMELKQNGNSLSTEYLLVYGDTNFQTGTRPYGVNTNYFYDFRVEVTAAEVNVKWYINSGLVADITVANSGAATPRSKPVSCDFGSSTATLGGNNRKLWFSEIILAEEDTRGMRVRELRPTSFGIHQEWSGTVEGLRDEDLATGITTATAERRTSFGVTNLQHVTDSDVISRIVVQSYAQRGETGLTSMNHYFRFGNGTVTDGPDIALDPLGTWYTEEFATNPDTGLAWTPADLAGIQTGVRSRT